MIKAIIFDMGGVVLTNKAESLYKRFCEILEIDFEKFWKIYGENKIEILKGKLVIKDFAKKINKRLGTNFSANKVLEAFKKAHLDIMATNNELLGFVKKLRTNFKTAVISNAAKEAYKLTKFRGLYFDFDVSIVSCEVGFMKPEKEIFELALRKLKLRPDECVFIDDRAEHLETPAQIGFKIIQFKNNAQLVVDLKSLGVAV